MSVANKRENLLPKLISLTDKQNETINNLTSMNKILTNLLLNYLTVEEIDEIFDMKRDYKCDTV